LPAPVRPLRLQRALSVPVYGLVVGMPPLGVMRRILPSRTCESREASFELWQSEFCA
jgi:hypothetical protein